MSNATRYVTVPPPAEPPRQWAVKVGEGRYEVFTSRPDPRPATERTGVRRPSTQ